jgi:glutathione S-transferase
MRFYDCATAPSPRRVRIFLAEKGISVPTVQVNLREGEQFGDAFRAINPDCTVPVLELDDGRRIADAVAICLYFEAVQPEPPLMGEDAADKAIVAAWQRRIERDGFYAVMEAFRNATPGLKGRGLPGADDYEQIPALAERGRARVGRFFAMLEARLAESAFLAGPRFSIADITALVTVDFARWIKLVPGDAQLNLKRWHDSVAARPSARA